MPGHGHLQNQVDVIVRRRLHVVVLQHVLQRPVSQRGIDVHGLGDDGLADLAAWLELDFEHAHGALQSATALRQHADEVAIAVQAQISGNPAARAIIDRGDFALDQSGSDLGTEDHVGKTNVVGKDRRRRRHQGLDAIAGLRLTDDRMRLAGLQGLWSCSRHGLFVDDQWLALGETGERHPSP